MIRIPIQSHQATTRWFRSISYMCIKEIWVWARSTRHKNKTQNQFFALEITVAGHILEEGGKENFFSSKIRTPLVFSHSENSSTLDPIKGEIFKIQNDKCHTLPLSTWHMSKIGLWIWQVSYTCQNSPISFSLGGKFKFWISFLPSLQNPPIDPSGLSTFESRPISAIGPQTFLGPKTLFVPI